MILHAHVRLADDWITARVPLDTPCTRVLHALVRTTPHNVTLRVATGGVIATCRQAHMMVLHVHVRTHRVISAQSP